MKKLLKIKTGFAFIFVAAIFQSCGDDGPGLEFAAKVNDSYLYEKEIPIVIDSNRLKESARADFIRSWVECELFYIDAKKKGLFAEKEFSEALEESKKQLAKSFIIARLVEQTEIKISDEDALKYFEENKNEFILQDDAYELNYVVFSDKEKAYEFRNELIENYWKDAVAIFSKDSSLMRSAEAEFIYEHQMPRVELKRIVQTLNQGEFSPVVKTGENEFYIINLSKKRRAGEVPEFGLVRKTAEERYRIQQKKNVVREFIKKLYAENNVIINLRN